MNRLHRESGEERPEPIPLQQYQKGDTRLLPVLHGENWDKTGGAHFVKKKKSWSTLMNVLGLEEAKPVMTPSVKRTPTTESLVELEGERRAMYRTVVGKLLYMCQ